jgi:hypothetical protein
VTNLLDSALGYVALGWPVLPLHTWERDRCTCGKPCESPAKHPRNAHGLHEASTDEDTIVSWWRRWPNANVGLRTGIAFDVLDVDGAEGQASVLAAGSLPVTPETFTGGGGNHLLFLPTGAGNRAGLLHKVDWRGQNGYIVAPPSLHASGTTYQWHEGPETPISEAPEWLRALVVPPPREHKPAQPVRFLPPGSSDGTPYGIRALDAELEELARTPEGMRNHNLNSSAFNLYQLVAGGELSEGVVVDRLTSVAMNIGLSEMEIRTTLGSARKKGITLPRSAPEMRLVVGGEPIEPPEPDYDIGDDEPMPEEPVRLLEIISAAELVRRVRSAPPVGWLVKPVWPADAYGILAAEQKAGKTWSGLDLVISVASGTPWMGMYEVDRPGMVLAFLGEGGERKMERRLAAICAARDLELEHLPIRFCFRVPTFTSMEHLCEMGEEIRANRPVLVYVDPLYLAAKGAKGSQLYEMGEHLSDVQILCQREGAALMIVHHWNKTGEGKGSKRMTGVGPGEWGRVLVSVSVVSKNTDEATRRTDVVLEWGFEGDEIPDTEMRIRRRVWADDPDDLNSPMHYEVDQLGDMYLPVEGELPAMRPSAGRVLAVLRKAAGSLTTQAIGDELAADNVGFPLKKRTIQAALEELETMGLAEKVQTFGSAHIWRAPLAPEEAF